MIVQLSKSEVAKAERIAGLRCRMNEKARRGGTALDSALEAHRIGAVGELAVANALELPWDGAYRCEADWQAWRQVGHDVAGLEVRSTPVPNGSLVLRRNDPADAIFVLAILRDAPPIRGATMVRLAGWAICGEVRTPSRWRSDWKIPCYAVPQAALQPMSPIVRLLRRCLKTAERLPAIAV